MRNYYPEHIRKFLVRIMEMLGNDEQDAQPILDILQETCRFLGFGCGFIYQSNYASTFFLRERYSLYDAALPEVVELETLLTTGEFQSLAYFKMIAITPNSRKTEMEEKLYRFFGASTLILVPVVNSDKKVEAIVGMSDRRIETLLDEDKEFAYSVLSLVANQVKIRIYQTRIENSQASLAAILNNTGIDIYVNDFYTHEILYLNNSMAAPYGGVEKMLGKICWQSLYKDKTGPCDFCPQNKIIDENGDPTKIYSWDYQRPFDGSWFRVLSAAFRWVDGRLAHIVSSVDITENKHNEDLVREMALVDSLTGLPNRRKLVNDCDECIREMRERGQEGFLVFFDLDGFKQVNDTLGHRAGDELLVQVGESLGGNPLTAGICYRHGGDEFVLRCENKSLDDVKAIIGILRDRFSRPWVTQDGEACCSASIGIAQFPCDGENAEELLHNADTAMYRSKENGKGHCHLYNRGNFLRLE